MQAPETYKPPIVREIGLGGKPPKPETGGGAGAESLAGFVLDIELQDTP